MNKIVKATLQLVILVSVCNSSTAAATWTGYVNKKTLEDRPYGYIVNTSTFNGTGKLRMVCFPPNEFRLYLDDGLTGESSTILLAVDRLTPRTLNVQQLNEGFAITNQASEFWDLVAQMVAGVVLTIGMDRGKSQKFSLSGFTQAYLNNCGWMKSATTYRTFLSKYR